MGKPLSGGQTAGMCVGAVTERWANRLSMTDGCLRAVASPLPLHVMHLWRRLHLNSSGTSQSCSSHFLRHHSFKRDATPSYFFSTLLGGASI